MKMYNKIFDIIIETIEVMINDLRVVLSRFTNGSLIYS